MKRAEPQHLSYSHYSGYKGHIQGGHGALHREYVKAPTNIFKDPPELLTGAHVETVPGVCRI